MHRSPSLLDLHGRTLGNGNPDDYVRSSRLVWYFLDHDVGKLSHLADAPGPAVAVFRPRAERPVIFHALVADAVDHRIIVADFHDVAQRRWTHDAVDLGCRHVHGALQPFDALARAAVDSTVPRAQVDALG